MNRRISGFSLVAALALASLTPVLAATAPTDTVAGQWIWSTRDAALYAEAQRSFPSLLPGVWVGTLSFRDDAIRLRLALSPVLETKVPVAAVLRLDETLHQSWDRHSPQEIAAEIDVQIRELLARIQGAGAELAEVQLDYDCPVRRLESWAEVVHYLSAHSLANRQVWITSLVSHLQAPKFGTWFRGAVAGHILQLFDTGESPGQNRPEALVDILTGQGLPFRIGLGAFERGLGSGGFTEHRAWFAALPLFTSKPGYRGLWIFPAGRPWLALLPESEKKP